MLPSYFARVQSITHYWLEEIKECAVLAHNGTAKGNFASPTELIEFFDKQQARCRPLI